MLVRDLESVIFNFLLASSIQHLTSFFRVAAFVPAELMSPRSIHRSYLPDRGLTTAICVPGWCRQDRIGRYGNCGVSPDDRSRRGARFREAAGTRRNRTRWYGPDI